MHDMAFVKNNKIIPLNAEHHQPIFIASGVEELRKNKNTRRVLKQFRIFEKCPDDEEEFVKMENDLAYVPEKKEEKTPRETENKSSLSASLSKKSS